jgi:hypothetical protein
MAPQPNPRSGDVAADAAGAAILPLAGSSAEIGINAVESFESRSPTRDRRALPADPTLLSEADGRSHEQVVLVTDESANCSWKRIFTG